MYNSLHNVQQSAQCTTVCTMYSSLHNVQQSAQCTAVCTMYNSLLVRTKFSLKKEVLTNPYYNFYFIVIFSSFYIVLLVDLRTNSCSYENSRIVYWCPGNYIYS
jgi:hypothetical protein